MNSNGLFIPDAIQIQNPDGVCTNLLVLSLYYKGIPRSLSKALTDSTSHTNTPPLNESQLTLVLMELING